MSLEIPEESLASLFFTTQGSWHVVGTEMSILGVASLFRSKMQEELVAII